MGGKFFAARNPKGFSGKNTQKEVVEQRRMEYKALWVEDLVCLAAFVNDLLDLRQLKDGVFSLNYSEFDPCETFTLVCNTFSPQSLAKGVKISWNAIDSSDWGDQEI